MNQLVASFTSQEAQAKQKKGIPQGSHLAGFVPQLQSTALQD